MTKHYRVSGYEVISSHGHTQRGSLLLERRTDGSFWVIDESGSDRDSTEIIFQEADDLPSEEWHGNYKYNIRAIGVVFEDDHAFVLDPAEVERLEKAGAFIDRIGDHQ